MRAQWAYRISLGCYQEPGHSEVHQAPALNEEQSLSMHRAVEEGDKEDRAGHLLEPTAITLLLSNIAVRGSQGRV